MAESDLWDLWRSKGHSQPYFFLPANYALNALTYSSEYIEIRLNPFIDKNYDNKRYLFWPDGASAHYASTTIKKFDELQIKYVKKDENPPNIPQLRPIERFWAHLKAKVYSNGWETDDIKTLKLRIRKKLRDFDDEYFKRLCANDKRKISLAAKRGPLSVIN